MPVRERTESPCSCAPVSPRDPRLAPLLCCCACGRASKPGSALRNKQNITICGEDRKEAIVRYANNGVFTPVGRSEFTLSGATGVHLINLTIQSVGKDENPAQAEALYAKGDKLQVHNVAMLGSGDALQIQTDTRIYLSRCTVRGYGDNLLSYGAAFFKSCELVSTYGLDGWPRNSNGNHGDVFVDSTFRLEGVGTSGDGHCTLARSPQRWLRDR